MHRLDASVSAHRFAEPLAAENESAQVVTHLL